MKKVRLIEVGLRDGLQNEKINLSVENRLELITQLVQAGVENFEIGAFVSPKWVPQMACTEDLVIQYNKKYKSSKKLHPSVLVPNEIGLEKAISHHLDEIAIFAACSESFSQKNINCSIDESFERFEKVVKLAKKNKIKIRGYLSVCFGCPYDGFIDEKRVVQLAKKLIDMGCYEVSIGDTIGIAHVGQVESLFKKLVKVIPVKKLAGHFHDTRGQALANILAAYKLGIRTFDSSIGGLGGCPYAKGATGNVATEDVVYMFHGMGIQTQLNLAQLIKTNAWLSQAMGKELSSKVGRIGLQIAL